MVLNVNTAYFDRNGGYEYAKDFFAEAFPTESWYRWMKTSKEGGRGMVYKRTIRCEKTDQWDLHECILCNNLLILYAGPRESFFCRLNLDTKTHRYHFTDLFYAHRLKMEGVQPIRRDVVVEYSGGNRTAGGEAK